MKKGWKKGSVTVEAALLIPILLSVFMAFLYFFQVIWIQEKVNHGLWQTAQEISQYGYVYFDLHKSDDKKTENEIAKDVTETRNTVKEAGEKNKTGNNVNETSDSKNHAGNTVNETDSEKNFSSKEENIASKYIKGLLTGAHMKKYISDDFLNSTCVVGGAGGVTYFTSAFQEDEKIKLQATYEIQMPLFQIIAPKMRFTQQVNSRVFYGTEKIGLSAEEESEIVYITKNSQESKVYHLSPECSYLKHNILQSRLSEMQNRRNISGGKYYPCEKCIRNQKLSDDTIVYYTLQGNRYHLTATCKTLAPDVIAKRKSELKGYRACTKCGGEQ